MWGVNSYINPNKNPIKLEDNRCSPNAYTFYKNNLGFSALWFEPRSGHMWESQVLLMDKKNNNLK